MSASETSERLLTRQGVNFRLRPAANCRRPKSSLKKSRIVCQLQNQPSLAIISNHMFLTRRRKASVSNMHYTRGSQLVFSTKSPKWTDIAIFYQLLFWTWQLAADRSLNFCFLLGLRLWWTFLPKERHFDSLSDCGSNIQAFYLKEDALTLSYSYLVFCRIYPIPLKIFKPSQKQIKYISQ